MSEETNAEIGFGLLIKMKTSASPVTFTTLGQMKDVTPSGFSVDMVDATHNESPDTEEEVVAGIVRTGETSFQIHYDPVSATMALLEGAKRVKKTFREVWPDGRYVEYDGYIQSVEPEAPTEDKSVAAVTLKRSGTLTANAAAAPSNLTLPAISGLLEVGEVLTAYEGVWANEPTSFTYQWYAASASPPAAIAGATSRTYTLQAGDETDHISVQVTAVNSAGSAAATSPATDTIAA
jgi:hypothetical protein